MTLIGRRPWAFALLYTVVSLAVEAALMVVAHLKPPDDNAILAPVVLTVPPVLAAVFSGYRRPARDLVAVAALASVLTLLVTIVVTRLTRVDTGLLEPIVNRLIAGSLAALATNRIAARRGAAAGES